MRTSLSRCAAALILLGLTGCQTGSGFSFWKGSSTTAPAAATVSTPATPASQPTQGPPAGAGYAAAATPAYAAPRKRQPDLSDHDDRAGQLRRRPQLRVSSHDGAHVSESKRPPTSSYASTQTPYATAPASVPPASYGTNPYNANAYSAAPAAASPYAASQPGGYASGSAANLASRTPYSTGPAASSAATPSSYNAANLQLQYANSVLHHAKFVLHRADFDLTTRRLRPTTRRPRPTARRLRRTTRRLRPTTRRPCRVRRRRPYASSGNGAAPYGSPASGTSVASPNSYGGPANGSYSTGSAWGVCQSGVEHAVNRQRLLRPLRHRRDRLEFRDSETSTAPASGSSYPANSPSSYSAPSSRRRRRASIPPAAIPTRWRPVPRRREAMRRICPAARAASRPMCRGLPPPHRPPRRRWAVLSMRERAASRLPATRSPPAAAGTNAAFA